MRRMVCFTSSRLYRVVLVSAGIAVFTLSVATASQIGSPAQVDEMKKLDFLVGDWKGEGWLLKPDGSRTKGYTQKVKVEAGSGTLRIKDDRAFKPAYDMMGYSKLDATISYNDSTKLYNWRGKNSKSTLEAKLLRDRTFQYGTLLSVTEELIDGNRKTTIEVKDNGEWHETLEVWFKDQWYKFEESILTRVK